MQNSIQNSVLIQTATLDDVARIVERTIDARMRDFYERIKIQPDPLVKRVDAAKMLGVSLPTLDNYGKFGILHPKHCGGRIYYAQSELDNYMFNHKK